MSSSGVTATFNLSVVELLEDAILQCGLPTSSLTAENLRISKRQLNLLFQEMTNRGINLWEIKRDLVGLYIGQASYKLSPAVVDLKSVNNRTVYRNFSGIPYSSEGDATLAFDENFDTSCTQTLPGGILGFQFNGNYSLSTIGFRTNGNQTYNLILEASTDGIVFQEIKSLGVTNFIDNKWYWYNVDPDGPYRYWQIRETGLGILNIRELVFSSQNYELQMARYNLDDYFNLPDKNIPGQSLNFWYNRQQPNPEIVLWPVPNTTFTQVVSIVAHQHIQDVLTATETLDIPQRWLDCISKNLAYRISKQIPQAYNRIQQLQIDAADAMNIAEAEESDKAPIYFEPKLRYYTR